MALAKFSVVRWVGLCLVVGLALVVTLPVSAIAPGLQEYFILGYEEHIYRMYASTGTVDAADPNERYMASIVDITVTADGQQVYYDHWEDGYEADILTPQQSGYITGTLIFGDGDPSNGDAGDYTGRADDILLAGDSLSLSSRYVRLNPEDVSGYVPVDPRDAAYIRFDGGDRIVSTGGPVALVHNMWPADLSATPPDRTIMGDAWEIYSTQALENGYSYRSPIGEDLAATQFVNVDLQVQALEDNTTVSVGNGVVTATFVLDRGQTYLSMGYIDTTAFTETLAVNVTVGTAIQSDKPVQAGVIAYNTGFQDRYYNMIPDIIWGREYMMPVPNNGSVAEVYIYNPNPYAITVTYADRSKNGTFAVPALSTVDYTTRAGSSVPALSSVYLSSDTPFWAIAAADSNSTSFDWGFTFIPQVFLTDEYYASWAPGNVLEPPRQSVCNASGNMGGTTLCRNGSPLWISAVEDGTMVNVDYNNDDVVDSTFTLNMFDVRLIRDNSDFDQSGTHIWTEGGQKIAVIWGEDPAVAGTQAPNLDVGHLVLPLYQGWLTPPIMLEKTASPEILPASGGTVTFKLTTTAAFFADLDNVVITDTLPYSWTYVSNSAVVTYSNGTSVHFEPMITTAAGQQTLYWNLAAGIGPEQPLMVTFDATLVAAGGIEAQHFDGFESNTYNNGTGPWLSNWIEANDDNNPTSGLVRIVGVDSGVTPHTGARQLRLSGKNTGTDPSIYRTVDLSIFARPVLRVNRYLRSLDVADNDTFGMDISTNGGASYTTILTWSTASLQNLWVGEEVDLSAYRTANVRLRLRSLTNTREDDYVYLDNVQIYDRLAVNTNQALARAIYRDHDYNVVARKTVYLSPFRLSKAAGASEAALGDTLVFTLTYENMSSAITGTNVILQDSLSPGFNFVSASAGGQYFPGTNTIKWAIGDLSPLTAASVVFTVTVNTTVPPNDGDVIENTAQLFSNQATVRSNTVAVTVRAPRIANVIKSAPGNAAPGDVITYTLSYANTGALTATQLLITDTLDAYLTYVPGSCSDNCTPLSGGAVLQWELAEVAPDATGVLSFAAQISDAVPAGAMLQNTAYYVYDALSDPRPTNTAATLISLVTLNKSASASRVGPDQTITFSLDYANAGGITQTHVLITDPVPAFTAYVAGSATSIAGVLTPTYSTDGGASYQAAEPADPATVTHLRWELAELTPGASGTADFQVRVIAADRLPNAIDIRNQASLTSAQGARIFSNQVVIPTVKLTLDKLGPGLVVPGATFTYTLRFGNPGSGAATALLSDTLPANVTFISANPAPATPAPLNWAVTIPANTNNLEYTVVVSVPADIPVGTELRNAATLSSAQHIVDDVLLTYIASPDVSLIPNNTATADQLQTLCYAHTVFNNSAYSDTVNLTAIHSVWTNPTLLLYRDVNANGKYEAATDVILTDTNSDTVPDTGLLPPEGLVRILACVTVPLDVADGSVNVTTLRAASTTFPGRFSEATDTTTVPVGAGLTLTKSQLDVDGAPLYPGDSLTYTLVLANVDVIPHTGVILTDAAPAGVTFTGGEIQPGGDLTVTATGVTATVASLAPGARVTVTLAAQLAPTMPLGLLTNTAYADSVQQAAPINAMVSAVVEGLTLAKTATDENGSPLLVGDIVRYVITVTNASTQTTQSGVVVTDTLPAGVTFVAADPAPSGVAPLVWNVGTLAPGATWTATVRVQVDGSANPIGANVAEVSSDQQTAQETDPVLPPGGGNGEVDPGLALAKTATDENGAPLYVGDIVRYVITVTNASTQTTQSGVVVTDTLPAGVTFVAADPAPSGVAPLVWNVGTLAPGATWTAIVRVQVDGSANPIGANVAVVSSDQQTAQETDPVLPPAPVLRYVLTVQTVGHGSVTIDPEQTSYAYGDVVTLTATADPGWTFAGWSGDAVGVADQIAVMIVDNTAITATFTQNEYTLTVDVVGSGSVTRDPDRATYHYGDVVTLTATPALGWSFAAWSGDADCADGVVTINGNAACIATFTQNEYTLTVNVVGSGSVTRDPDRATYHYGDVVTLTATPDADWDFAGWSGDLAGAANPTQVTMNGNKAVTATFSLKPVTPVSYTLTLATTGDGYGSLTPEVGMHEYLSGTTVLITATAQADSEFVGWSGDFTGTANPASVLMDSNKRITATFRLKSVCEPLTNVGIDGPILGYTDNSYTFTGVMTPTGATAPLTLTWSPLPLSGQGTLTATYAWTTAGVYTLTLRAEHCGGVLTATHLVTIEAPTPPLCEPDAYEEDDTPQTARAIAMGESQTRNFVDDAVDWITITVRAGNTYTFATTIAGPSVDTVLSLFDRDGQTLLVENDNAPGALDLASRIVWQAPNNGVYYLRITNQTGFAGCETDYTVHVTVKEINVIYLPLVMRNVK
ncbi:MAG: hypothetical protein WHX52_09385 [Anaerolineae bacterium]